MENIKNKNRILYAAIVLLVVLAAVVTTFCTVFSGANYTTSVSGTSSDATVAKVVFISEAYNTNISFFDEGSTGVFWVRTQNYQVVDGVTIKSEVNLTASVSITVPVAISVGGLKVCDGKTLGTSTDVPASKTSVNNGDGTITYSFVPTKLDRMNYTITYTPSGGKKGEISKFFGVVLTGGLVGTYSNVKVTVTATQRD